MTTTSRERREAVAAAIRRAQYRWVRMETHTDILSEAMADAALAAALPDRAAFEAAVDEMNAANKADEHIRTSKSMDRYLDARRALIALVFDDDAQAGDQEGAEHDGVG